MKIYNFLFIVFFVALSVVITITILNTLYFTKARLCESIGMKIGGRPLTFVECYVL